jgi:hypothetical protein
MSPSTVALPPTYLAAAAAGAVAAADYVRMRGKVAWKGGKRVDSFD